MEVFLILVAVGYLVYLHHKTVEKNEREQKWARENPEAAERKRREAEEQRRLALERSKEQRRLAMEAERERKEAYAAQYAVESAKRTAEAAEASAKWKGEQEEALRRLHAVIQAHVHVLYAQRLKKRPRDAYGNLPSSLNFDWDHEKEYFFDSVVAKSDYATAIGRHFKKKRVIELIDEVLDRYEARHDSTTEIGQLSPTAYEAYCASLLNKAGWRASTTRGSGDQGVDVIAHRDGVSAVFQCKKYTQPVGNKAVQEAIAGRAFLKADHAFVVSNASFTPSAVALAAEAGVFLVNHSSLSDLSQFIRFPRRP